MRMEAENYFVGEIVVVLATGTRVPAKVSADEICGPNNKETYRITLEQGAEIKIAESQVDFFDALIKLRLDLEKTGTLLCCFGASENVYPSGMQRSMGPAVLAYKMRLGSPTSRQDIVNIFESDETVVPATVEQQEGFHRRWGDSLQRR
ncbi:hypothetical protein ACQR1W_19880 [Bradyrhizobium sp. HKCCYLS1011]|uniref:hypothetical protein n=1 Tax=Bradyrhizobium sp. HKCCYLS1011 TaxID=3420733 RepID=UPI003EBD0D56